MTSAIETTTEEAEAEAKKSLGETLRAMTKLSRAFWVANGVFFLDGAAYFGILNVLALYLGTAQEAQRTIGFSTETAHFLTAAYGGTVTVAAAIFGPLIDKIGYRKTLLYSMVLAVIGRALLAFSVELPAPKVFAVIALVIAAVSAATTTTGVYAGVKESTTKATSALGFSILYALLNGGNIVESIASPSVRGAWGIPGVVWMCTAITAVGVGLALAIPRREGGPVARVVDPSRPAGLRGHPLASPRFLFFIFILLPVRTLFAHQFLTLEEYITRAYEPEVAKHFEWVFAINPFIILFGTPLVALFTSRVHVVKMMVLGTLVSASSTFLLVPGPSVAALIAYQIIFALGEAMWSSRFYEWVAGNAPSDRIGVYMGVAQFPWFLAKFTTGFYSGFMIERFCPVEGARDTGTLWLVYGCVGMISPVGLWLARKWLQAGKL